MFSKHSLTIAAYLFLPFTLGSLAIAGYFWFNSMSRQWEWQQAEATVTGIEWVESESVGTLKFAHAVLTFTTEDGQKVSVLSQMASSEQPLYQVHDTLPVIYPPQAPQEAEENVFIVQYLLPLSVTVMALFSGAITLLLFILGRRAQKKNTLPPAPQA